MWIYPLGMMVKCDNIHWGWWWNVKISIEVDYEMWNGLWGWSGNIKFTIVVDEKCIDIYIIVS
jgi:hypothetical protein